MRTGILCKGCGVDIGHKPSNRRNFCTYACFTLWVQKVHPNRIREKRLCQQCGKEFESAPCEPKRFCSCKCSVTYFNLRRRHSQGTKDKIRNAINQGLKCGRIKKTVYDPTKHTPSLPLLEYKCRVCGKSFVSKAKDRKYCSLECAYARPEQGGYHPGSVRNYKSGWYESPIAGRVWLDSSYEFIVAKHLDEKGYKWKKNANGFPYVAADGSGHLYVPDFYIESLDVWVETKGYMVDNDQLKFKAFPHKLIVITKKTIYDKSVWGF